ncbi:hypothetical protein VNO77_19332 [Canavalia gladiata]|uniref:Uncharacterized protein n=1 Tax=Canavalia gladiata TaxID=3824 RepID=A0AAN9QKE0_CANGL
MQKGEYDLEEHEGLTTTSIQNENWPKFPCNGLILNYKAYVKKCEWLKWLSALYMFSKPWVRFLHGVFYFKNHQAIYTRETVDRIQKGLVIGWTALGTAYTTGLMGRTQAHYSSLNQPMMIGLSPQRVWIRPNSFSTLSIFNGAL